jgi:phosphatidylethanolamine-binding protein (PEBP) family uncharacterized protein
VRSGDRPHPYQFTVWALKTDNLPIDSNTSGAMVGDIAKECPLNVMPQGARIICYSDDSVQ